jgi:ElaB/YqjD/DUF883 family membrane-anchored ribosome-binding protein
MVESATETDDYIKARKALVDRIEQLF